MRVMLVRGCGMFVTFATLLGAIWYSKSVVTVGLLFTCYQASVAVINLRKYNLNGGNGRLEVIFPLVWSILNFYAQGVFISEVNDGIMSAETYKRREKYSCCCNFC